MTVQELINASGRLIGELRADRSFGVTESAQLLVSLNQMLANWSAGKWAIAHVTRELIGLSGAVSYAVPVRPLRILAAAVIATSTARKGIEIVTADRFTAENIDGTATGLFADILYPDYAAGCNVYLYPKPSGGSLELHSLKPLTALASLAATVDFLPGYEQALTYNFALKIAPDFSKTAAADVAAIAETSRAAIAELNAQLHAAIAPAA